MTIWGLGNWLQRNWRKLILAIIAAVVLQSLYLHYCEEQRFALISELLSDSGRIVEIDNSWRRPPFRLPNWIRRLGGRELNGSQRFEVKRIIFAADDPPELVDRARRIFSEADIKQAVAQPPKAAAPEAAPPATK